MIVGDTGVGKSMFLHVFKKLFQEEHGAEVPIVEANCAHFEKGLARSELFGHAKGSFTTASETTEGLVHEAKDGLLILEEVGELPEEVQAQLLTFIESGRYRGVGKKEKKANVRIVGATNNEEALRNDFRNRFFPFYVSSLHERRGDILYYLADSFPELISTLNMIEVLTLLAYNWPGNVREIDRVVRLIRLHKMQLDRDYPESEIKIAEDGLRKIILSMQKSKENLESKRLFGFHYKYNLLNARAADQIVKRVESWGGDSAFLERLLNRLLVGLATVNSKKAFNNKKIIDWVVLSEEHRGINGRFGIRLLEITGEFWKAAAGFEAFCNLFGQDPFKNSNILFDTAGGIYDETPTRPMIRLSDNKVRKLKKLLRAIMRSLLEIPLSDKSYPDNPDEYWKKLFDQKEQYMVNQENKIHLSKKFEDIWSMTPDELLKIYYEGLLKRSGGNATRVAKTAGIPLGTLIGRLDKLGVKHGRNTPRL